MTKDKMRKKLEELGVIANENLSGKELEALLKSTQEEAALKVEEEPAPEPEPEPKSAPAPEPEPEPAPAPEPEPEPAPAPEPEKKSKSKKEYYAGKEIVSRDTEIINGIEREFVIPESGERILI